MKTVIYKTQLWAVSCHYNATVHYDYTRNFYATENGPIDAPDYLPVGSTFSYYSDIGQRLVVIGGIIARERF